MLRYIDRKICPDCGRETPCEPFYSDLTVLRFDSETEEFYGEFIEEIEYCDECTNNLLKAFRKRTHKTR